MRVDLGGRRIIEKKIYFHQVAICSPQEPSLPLPYNDPFELPLQLSLIFPLGRPTFPSATPNHEGGAFLVYFPNSRFDSVLELTHADFFVQLLSKLMYHQHE